MFLEVECEDEKEEGLSGSGTGKQKGWTILTIRASRPHCRKRYALQVLKSLLLCTYIPG